MPKMATKPPTSQRFDPPDKEQTPVQGGRIPVGFSFMFQNTKTQLELHARKSNDLMTIIQRCCVTEPSLAHFCPWLGPWLFVGLILLRIDLGSCSQICRRVAPRKERTVQGPGHHQASAPLSCLLGLEKLDLTSKTKLLEE